MRGAKAGKFAPVLAIILSLSLLSCSASATILSQSQGASGAGTLRGAQRNDLLYVSTGGTINIYTYPDGAYIGGLVYYGPNALCTDQAGDVFVPEYSAADLMEYAHGRAFPIATTALPHTNPFACAVDPTASQIAVTSYDKGSSHGGGVMFVGNPPPERAILSDPRIYFYYFCGYDTHGNLFIDGEDERFRFILDELPKGAQRFTTVTIRNLPKPILLPGNIQWDGAFLALGDIDRNVIYRLGISGAKAKVMGITRLQGAHSVYQFFITPIRNSSPLTPHNLRIIGGANLDSFLRYWNYPAGGPPSKKISASYDAYGVVLSRGS